MVFLWSYATYLNFLHLIKKPVKMKKPIFKILLVPICLLLFSTQCEEDIVPLTIDDEQQELTILKTEIENLASASICGDTFECKFIGLGSKPCGGPRSYLVYSTSINFEELENLVDAYNQKESEFNTKWEIVSDCATTNTPTSISCENNTCIAVY